MKKPALYIYRSIEFDGDIYFKITGAPEGSTYNVTLFKEGNPLGSQQRKAGLFAQQSIGKYQASVLLTATDGPIITLTSNELNIQRPAKKKVIFGTPTTKATKEIPKRYDGISQYSLQIKLETENSINKLKQESVTHLPLFHKIKATATYHQIGHNDLFGNILPNTYSILPYGQFDELVAIANELEKLDYVIYCTVVPDTHLMPPPVAPLNPGSEETHEIGTQAITPNFQELQTYLRPSDGRYMAMTVLPVWHKNEIGRAASVRHLDFGIYHNHEDLKDNITVVNSRPETLDCNHGTASAGCIAASNNGFGVTGIAYGCDFYFYDTDDLDLIIRDAVPGDIVSLDIQIGHHDSVVPMINVRSWWDRIYALTQKGAVVILAAGNGYLDISVTSGNMNQFGDCGGSLVGACYHSTGKRVAFSNFNHPTSLFNSWGDWSVVTTGYGSLQRKEGNNRNYSYNYEGTSSATPLVSGALALIQSYAIANLGVYLNAQEMRNLIRETGYSQGLADGIGHRPNVYEAIFILQQRFNQV